MEVLFLEYLGIFLVFVPFKLIEKYFSSDCISPDKLIEFTNVFKAYKTLCLILKDVKRERSFSSAILLKLKPFNKLSIIFFHTSNGNLLWHIMVFVVSEYVFLQQLHIYF